MSFYKEEFKKFFADELLFGKSALSIGAQVDDRKYFKGVEIEEWKTLDFDEKFNPDIVFDINKQMTDEDGDLFIDYDYLGYFDYVLALNLWEYVYDPVTAHKNIYSLLASGGTYWGSYVFVYGKHNPAGTDYLRYTDDGIRKLLSVSGFKDVMLIPISARHTNRLTEFYRGEEMRIRNDVDHDIVGYIVRAKK